MIAKIRIFSHSAKKIFTIQEKNVSLQKMKEYSIKVLFGNITKLLHESESLDTEYYVQNGLDASIITFDEGVHASDSAYITRNPITKKNETRLSVAFCQFYWLICDIILKYADISIVKEECSKSNKHLRDYYEEALHFKYLYENNKEITSIIPNGYCAKDFYDYLNKIIPLLDESQFNKKQKEELDLALSIITNEEIIDFERISKIDYDHGYSTTTNSAFCFGIAFILKHELGHHACGHLDKVDKIQQDEEAADELALWVDKTDSEILDSRQRFSRFAGILCCLTSLFFLNPKLEIDEDDPHPTEDCRLFNAYKEIMKDDPNPKYAYLIYKTLSFWSEYFSIPNFPQANSDYTTIIPKIESFFEQYKQNIEE